MDDSVDPPGSPAPTPETLFVDWLARREGDDPVDLEAICRNHPEHQARLRELRTEWEEIEGILQRAGLGGSLAERLSTRYGSEVDPKISLAEEPTDPEGFSSDVLERLAGRGPASTRYRLKGEVAHGGMGAVLRVWDEDLRRHLAMKVMLGEGTARQQGDTPAVNAKLLARFLEEAQATGQLDHPGIVPVHELGLDEETPHETAYVWNASTGELLSVREGLENRASPASIDPASTRAVAQSSVNALHIRDAATGEELGGLDGCSDWAGSAVYSPDRARFVTTTGSGTARVWDAANGESITELKGHADMIQSMAFSPDGTRIVTASLDKTAMCGTQLPARASRL